MTTSTLIYLLINTYFRRIENAYEYEEDEYLLDYLVDARDALNSLIELKQTQHA